MSEVHIVALLNPKKDSLDRVTELLKAMCKNVHTKEPDAHRYLMTTQTNSDEPTVVMIETYKNQQVAKEHGETQHFQDTFGTFVKEELMAKPPLILYTSSTAGFDLDRKLI